MEKRIKSINKILKAEELSDSDRTLFIKMLKESTTGKELEFFQSMAWKEENECVYEVDIIMDENDNEDNLFILRQGLEEYIMGQGLPGHRKIENISGVDLSDLLSKDLYLLIGKHITLQEWLKKRDYNGINYNGNTENSTVW